MITSLQEFVELLSRSDEVSRLRVRSEVAHPSVWEDVIHLRPDLKRAMTLNKTLDEKILLILASDEDHSVRSDVAMMRRLSRELFLILAKDPDEKVRRRVALNKKVPRDILAILQNDQSASVAEAANERIRD